VPRCGSAGRLRTWDFESSRQKKVDCSFGVGLASANWLSGSIDKAPVTNLTS